MKNKTIGYVYFYINGDDLDLDKCTKSIGLIPTRACHKGDYQGEKLPLARIGRWEIKIKNNEMREINTDTVNLIKTLLPVKKEIHSILKTNKNFISGIWCVVYAEDERPELKLTAKCLRKLAKLGVKFEIDYYDGTE